MIGVWQAYAGTFLVVAGIAMLAAFGLPLLMVPLSWARLLHWEIPASSQLATFLGRSLGVFLCVFAAYAIKAALMPAAQPFVFELMLWLLVAMLALHIYGALRKAQPITETIEIALWVVLILATLAFWPAA
jgi:small-conductance mechanosensitive channel